MCGKCTKRCGDFDMANWEGRENIHDTLQHKDAEEDKFHNLDEN